MNIEKNKIVFNRRRLAFYLNIYYFVQLKIFA